MTKKRWLSLFAENDVGVLARISGLFAGKAYNLESLTVGPTEDITISRMTIGLTSDDRTFEQIKKQLNRCVEVIEVMDLTGRDVFIKELMFIKLYNCPEACRSRLDRVCRMFDIKMTKLDSEGVLLESTNTEEKNNELIRLLKSDFTCSVEIVRGGSVAVENML